MTYTVGKEGSLSPSAVRCWSLQAVKTIGWSPEHCCLVLRVDEFSSFQQGMSMWAWWTEGGSLRWRSTRPEG